MSKKQLRAFLDRLNEDELTKEELRARAKTCKCKAEISEVVSKYAASIGFNFSVTYLDQQLDIANELSMGSGDRMQMMLKRLQSIWYLSEENLGTQTENSPALLRSETTATLVNEQELGIHRLLSQLNQIPSLSEAFLGAGYTQPEFADKAELEGFRLSQEQLTLINNYVHSTCVQGWSLGSICSRLEI
jgi:hypothetical protein